MSMIDTVCIGQFAGTGELAALAPANMIFQFVQYGSQALSLTALSLAGQRFNSGDKAAAQRSLSTVLFLALGIGLASLCVLQVLAPGLISGLGAAPAVVDGASEYLRIRALAQPAVMALMVCQAALLAQGNTHLPAALVLATCGLSLLGDLVLLGAWNLGLKGAAWTTVGTQYLSASVALAVLRPGGGAALPLKPMVPRPEEVSGVLHSLGPLSAAYLFKNSAFVMLQGTAVAMDVLSLAAHQVAYSLWNMCSFLVAPVERVALTLLPRQHTAHDWWHTARQLTLLGVAVGAAAATLTGGLLTLAPSALTADEQLFGLLAAVVPQAVACHLLDGADAALTGSLLARGHASYVAGSMAAAAGLLAAWLHTAAGPRAGIAYVWSALVLFYVARACMSGLGALWLWHQQRQAAYWTARQAGFAASQA